ncbi:MAG TPA: hypothetical protein V6C95_22080 [Coleofasciculaceae cyanobacterium]
MSCRRSRSQGLIWLSESLQPDLITRMGCDRVKPFYGLYLLLNFTIDKAYESL